MSHQTQKFHPSSAQSAPCQISNIPRVRVHNEVHARVRPHQPKPAPSITQHQYYSSFQFLNILKNYTKIFFAPFFHVLLRSKPLALDLQLSIIHPRSQTLACIQNTHTTQANTFRSRMLHSAYSNVPFGAATWWLKYTLLPGRRLLVIIRNNDSILVI